MQAARAAAAVRDGDPIVVGMEEPRVEVPEILRCPLTHQIMRQPVTASDGHVYEREAIVKHMSVAAAVSPFTREAFGSRDVLIHDAITTRVTSLLREHPELILADEVYCPYSFFLAMKDAVVAKNIGEISRLATLDVRLLVRSPFGMHSVYWPVLVGGLRNAFEMACELEDASDSFILEVVRLVQRLYPSYVHERVAGLPDWNPVSLSRTMTYAAWNGNRDNVELLLDFGAQIESGNRDLFRDDHWRALQLAARRGHLEIVRLLLDRHAQVDAVHLHDWTALQIVVHNHAWDGTPSLTWAQREPILSLLVEQGADIAKIHRSPYLDGYNSLHIAAYRLDLDAASFLLDQGIFVDSKTLDGKTALYIASDGGDGRPLDSPKVREMIALLMSRGANPRVRRIAEAEGRDARLEVAVDDRCFAMGTPGVHLRDRFTGVARMVDELHGEQVVEAYRRVLALEHVVRAQAAQIALLNTLLVELRPDFRERLGLDVAVPPPLAGAFAALALVPDAAAGGAAPAAGGAGARAPGEH